MPPFDFCVVTNRGLMDAQQEFSQASLKTAESLKSIAKSLSLQELSKLTLPEIEAVIDLIARVVPAGNVPGVILSGMARLSERKIPGADLRRDVDLLFKGVEQVVDRAIFGAFFAGPAAVIWGYQNLLRLVGRDPEDAFPDGTWQFYVEYALREDSARHANETHGFDTTLRKHQLSLSHADRVAAWVMAAIHCLHQYDALLENEWRERVFTQLLADATTGTRVSGKYDHLYRAWQKELPYGRGSDSHPDETYPAYRKARFNRFLENHTRDVPTAVQGQWQKSIREAEKRDLPAYLRQMTLLAYLDPGTYGETRTPIALERAHVGVVYQGRYYLIPACQPKTNQPPSSRRVREMVAALVAHKPDQPPAQLAPLVEVRRAALPAMRKKFGEELLRELDTLRLAPIIFNADTRRRDQPLLAVRQTERGTGDHALTIFDTGESIVLDQSHIFFDGAWGAALAEILTNEALAWARHFSTRSAAQAGDTRPYSPELRFDEMAQGLIREAPKVTREVGAESGEVNIKAILKLRKRFKQRSAAIQLTVNDLLVLYRAVHAATYHLAPDLQGELDALVANDATRGAALAVQEAVKRSRKVNPAILIPVDTSQTSPRERLHPVSFEVPLEELNFLDVHHRVVAALDAYQRATENRQALFAQFNGIQREYLAMLAGFGQVLTRVKYIAIAGESASVGTIKLLAHMPGPIQRLLDTVPDQFEMLNDIIKGREVFSNVGAVAPSSTLTRFITAKDDNEKKTLAWGVITDAEGVMRLSLRDFRPHVGLLRDAGRDDLAQRLAQDYLDAYAAGLNDYVRALDDITAASRDTKPERPAANSDE